MAQQSVDGRNPGCACFGVEHINDGLHASKAGADLSQVEDQLDTDTGGFHVLVDPHHFRTAAMDHALPMGKCSLAGCGFRGGDQFLGTRDDLVER